VTKLEVGYLVWGVFALCLFIPECLAYFGKSFTPFPGAARTAANLEARWPLAAMIVLAGSRSSPSTSCSTPGPTRSRPRSRHAGDRFRRARLFHPWKAERSPASQASRSPAVLRSQSGRISAVTARRSRRRSSTPGRPQNQ
jgi:hypothetical protein